MPAEGDPAPAQGNPSPSVPGRCRLRAIPPGLSAVPPRPLGPARRGPSRAPYAALSNMAAKVSVRPSPQAGAAPAPPLRCPSGSAPAPPRARGSSVRPLGSARPARSSAGAGGRSPRCHGSRGQLEEWGNERALWWCGT